MHPINAKRNYGYTHYYISKSRPLYVAKMIFTKNKQSCGNKISCNGISIIERQIDVIGRRMQNIADYAHRTPYNT
jgi:hypothetical protein